MAALNFVVVFVIVGVGVGMDEIGPAEMVAQFPQIHSIRIVENILYLVVLVLWIPHFLAMYWATKQTSLAPALFGSAIGIAGLTVLTAGALPHVVDAPIANAFQSAGVSVEEQAALVLIWEAVHALNDSLLIAALCMVPVAYLTLGSAMLGSPDFGKIYGWLGLVIGALGVVAAVMLVLDPTSPMAGLGMLLMIVFHSALGWKLYSMSRSVMP